jgi:hypothetical protein
MPGVNPVGTSDRKWTDTAERAGVLEKGKSAHGKTAQETKKAQQPTASHGLGDTAKHAVVETAGTLLEGASGVGAGLAAALLGPGFVLYEFLHAFNDAHLQGEALRDAFARDAVNLAFVYAAAGALPPGYVAHIRGKMRAVDGERGGAMKILNRAMANDTEWQALQKQAGEHVRAGRAIANRLGVTTPQALEARLKSDPNFALLYSKNLGFKHGVDSVLHENAQRGPQGAG